MTLYAIYVTACHWLLHTKQSLQDLGNPQEAMDIETQRFLRYKTQSTLIEERKDELDFIKIKKNTAFQ